MTIRAHLRQRLSDASVIVLPEDPDFAGLTARWREWHAPGIGAVVRPATEADVQEIVRYANERDIPFLARSGGHGATEALAAARDAIQIDLRHMNKVEVSPDGTSAKVGGGANVKQLVNGLAACGKQTVSGICELVGVSAPILGGGHGWLQGQYGLAADQVLSARLVLPDGGAVTVSQDSNPDLFWAIRGAGHNFGIVTEWQLRVYDMKNPKWGYDIFVFSGDKLEALYTLTNDMMKTQPPEVTHWAYILSPAELNPEHPLIWYGIIYDGPADKAHQYARPLHDIGPIKVDSGEADAAEVAVLTFQDENGPGCAYGSTPLRFPIGLKSYNIDSVRRVYDDMDRTFQEIPELRGSLFLLEGYSTQGVKAVDGDSSAFPHRDDDILASPCIMYKPDPAVDDAALAFGLRLRDHLLQGSDDPARLRAYVNYAHGTESLEEVYGWDEARLARLRDLKAKWDPHNRMRYYMAIE